MCCPLSFVLPVFFNDTATTEVYTLSLHDALPISGLRQAVLPDSRLFHGLFVQRFNAHDRSEEHTSELQSHLNLVCRLLLEENKRAIRQPEAGTKATAAQEAPATPTAQ